VAGDGKTVAAIEALGTPPWTDPRAMGILRRATRVYEAKVTEPAPQAWWVRAPFYATPQMLADYESGEDFSWIQFVGMKGKGMLSTVDLARLGSDFAMPVFMIQGDQDLVTLPAVARAYFDSIRAPQKAWFPLPRTGHDPNPAMIAAQYQVLKSRAAPLAQ
jgi:pimeloyl-ACP methyl ester carboxylesterase